MGNSGKSSIIRKIQNSDDLEEISIEEESLVKKGVVSTLLRSKYTDNRFLGICKDRSCKAWNVKRKLEIFEVNQAGRKWMHNILDMNALIFVVDTSCGYEELNQSLELFSYMWNYIQPLRHQVWVHLFLNKQDKLEEKINSGDKELQEYFPDFASFSLPPRARNTSDVHSVEYHHARYFIQHLFQKIVDDGSIYCSVSMSKECFTYFTSVGDDTNTSDDVQSCVQQLIPSLIDCEDRLHVLTEQAQAVSWHNRALAINKKAQGKSHKM